MTVDSVHSLESKLPEKRPVRTPASRDSSKSVYDRLYKTSTASSKARKEVAPVVAKNFLMRENEDPSQKPVVAQSKRRPKKPTPHSSQDAVFNRLYNKGTASSVSKHSSRAPMKPKNDL